MTEFVELALFVAAAALLGNVVRKYDPPVTMKLVQEFVLGYGGAVIAAALTTWGMMSSGIFAVDFEPFVIVAMSAVGGMSTVRAVLSKFTPKAEE
jgi:hypothetical protein